MEKRAVKEVMFGGILELARNSRYYYYSKIGEGYSHWTDEGKVALQSLMDGMAWKMITAEEAELEKRAQQQTLDILKGDVKK